MTDAPFNPYEVLGVEPTATHDQIHAAYRKKAAEAHPDREGGSLEAMKDVNMAWEILKDPQMRQRFDESGATTAVDPIEVKAQNQILQIVKILIRELNPYTDDLVLVTRMGIDKQLEGLKNSRRNTHQDLDRCRAFLKHLKGPPDNPIESMLLREIQRGEEQLPTYDADEAVLKKALEILREYSYGPAWQSPLLVGLGQGLLGGFPGA